MIRIIHPYYTFINLFSAKDGQPRKQQLNVWKVATVVMRARAVQAPKEEAAEAPAAQPAPERPVLAREKAAALREKSQGERLAVLVKAETPVRAKGKGVARRRDNQRGVRGFPVLGSLAALGGGEGTWRNLGVQGGAGVRRRHRRRQRITTSMWHLL